VGVGEVHFRELGVNTQTQDFTVAGIGDMSGDVFANGMLLSDTSAGRRVRPSARLPRPVAGRRHVRSPNVGRMFAIPRSSWADYDTSLSPRAAASTRAP